MEDIYCTFAERQDRIHKVTLDGFQTRRLGPRGRRQQPERRQRREFSMFSLWSTFVAALSAVDAHVGPVDRQINVQCKQANDQV